MEKLLNELLAQQKKKLLHLAQEIVPRITEEDLLQPNDFPSLENCPYFRYEEGILQGIFTTKIALCAFKKEE